jgi:hypothetical protein
MAEQCIVLTWRCLQSIMSHQISGIHPEPGWAVLLYGPPPEIQLLAGELHRSGLRIVHIAGHFFLQAPEVFNPLSLPEEVAWAAAATLQQLNTAARLRYSVRLPVYSGSALLIDRDGRWNQDDAERAISEVRGDGPRPLQLPLGKIWRAARNRHHLARALDMFALGSAAWNLRQAFEEALQDVGPAAEAWIAGLGRETSDNCAWFRATVGGSTPRRPGLSRRSRFPWPKSREHAMPPLAAKAFVRGVLEQIVILQQGGLEK